MAMQYASFFQRVVAGLFDLALINVVIMLIADVVLAMSGTHLDAQKLELAMQGGDPSLMRDPVFIQQLIQMALILSLISVVVVLVVDAILPATVWRASPGKKLLGLLIVSEAGERISYAKAMGRHAAKFASFMTLIGLLMPLWQSKRQTLHDRMCATVVVKAKSIRGQV